MAAPLAYGIALTASLIWFGMGFRFFTFQQDTAAKLLIPRTARDSPLFLTTAAGLRFLGGMNAAFTLMAAVLLGLLLFGSELFTSNTERGMLLVVLGTAHFSQFAANVPVLLGGERQGEAYWPVLSGTMRTIFVVDAAQAMLCAVVAIVLFSR